MPPKGLPLTDYMYKGALRFAPLGPEVYQLLPLRPANWCPESLTDALEIAPCSDDQAVSRAPVTLSGHKLAGFQGTIWQASGPYKHLYVCNRSMGGPWEATNVPLNLPRGSQFTIKLDGVGPADNKPSTD